MGANKLIVAGAGLAALLAVSPCRQESVQPSVPLEQRAEEKAQPRTPVEPHATVLRFARNSAGLVESLEFECGAAYALKWSDYQPVFCTIPGLSLKEHFPVEREHSLIFQFKKAQNVEEEELIIYGLHPQTRQEVILYKVPLGNENPFEQKRWY